MICSLSRTTSRRKEDIIEEAGHRLGLRVRACVYPNKHLNSPPRGRSRFARVDKKGRAYHWYRCLKSADWGKRRHQIKKVVLISTDIIISAQLGYSTQIKLTAKVRCE